MAYAMCHLPIDGVPFGETGWIVELRECLYLLAICCLFLHFSPFEQLQIFFAPKIMKNLGTHLLWGVQKYLPLTFQA
jgi:hypothetical protein